MPNHITNDIRFYCENEKVEEIRSFMTNKADRLAFDFNKLIPMPEHIFRGDLGKPEMDKYGKDNWYDWSVENWGTKWNAYDVVWSAYGVRFCTAWSSVPEIVKALSKRFPDVDMDYRWADEDVGYNVGEIRGIIGGDLYGGEEFCPVGGSRGAYELSFDILDASPEDFELRYNEKTETYDYRGE